MKLEFFQQIYQKRHISIFMTIREVGADMPHADGQADGHDEANSDSSQLSKRA
jgi:hypothetical protein